MELPRIPDAGPPDAEALAEGKAWCPTCDRTRGYRASKVEFLGNPVKVSCFCLECDQRMFPEAKNRSSAKRLQKSAWRLRVGAASFVFLMLMMPLLLAALAIYLLWRIF